MTSLSKPRPVQQFRVGGITASVWRKEHEDKVFHSVSIERSYKCDGVWKRTSSFGKDELDVVIDLATRAKAYVEQAEAKQAA